MARILRPPGDDLAATWRSAEFRGQVPAFATYGAAGGGTRRLVACSNA